MLIKGTPTIEFIKAFGGGHGTSYTASCKAGEYYLIAANNTVAISGSISVLYSKTSDIYGTVMSYQALFVTTGTSFSVTTSNTSAQLAKLTF